MTLLEQEAALGEEQALKDHDQRLTLEKRTYTLSDGCEQERWCVIVTLDDGSTHVGRSQCELVGVADAYIHQQHDGDREERERKALEPQAAREGVPVYVLEHRRLQAQRNADLDRQLLAPLRAKYGYSRPLRRDAQPRTTPRERTSRRPRAARASGPRRARATTRSDDDRPSPPRPCECGCGEFAPPGRRTVNETHATRVRLRRLRARRRVDVDPEERLDELARQRREQFVRTAENLGPAADLRERVNGLADERLELCVKLPDANGDTPDYLARLHALNDEIERTWEEIRTVEAVAA